MNETVKDTVCHMQVPSVSFAIEYAGINYAFCSVSKVKNALLEMMGVLDICIDGDKIEIQYDLMQIDAEQIAVQLALIGTDLGRGWVDRLKLAFINY